MEILLPYYGLQSYPLFVPCNPSVCKGLQGRSVTNCYDGRTCGKFVCGQNSYVVSRKLTENTRCIFLVSCISKFWIKKLLIWFAMISKRICLSYIGAILQARFELVEPVIPTVYSGLTPAHFLEVSFYGNIASLLWFAILGVFYAL